MAKYKKLTTVAIPELEMEMPWLELMFMMIQQGFSTIPLATQLSLLRLHIRSSQLNFT